MGKVYPGDEGQPISFSNRKDALLQLPAEQPAGVTAHLLTFLRHRKAAHAPVTVARVKWSPAASGDARYVSAKRQKPKSSTPGVERNTAGI